MEQKAKIHPDYPEEYVTGKVTFFGREFRVTSDVLIPRLETEGLVRCARKHLQSSQHPITVIDIGCGSGIIGTSVADLADEVIFLDISSDVLEVAEMNFRHHFPEKKGDFILSDLLTNLPENLPSNVLFLANLPYIKAEDWENMSADTRFEPELALFGGETTGFEMYERLFEQLGVLRYEFSEKCYPTISPSDYPTFRLIVEFGFDQREIAEETIKKYGWKYVFFPDYAGIERFCEIELTNSLL